LKSINTAILKVGEAKLTMKREKSIFLINAASVTKNERPMSLRRSPINAASVAKNERPMSLRRSPIFFRKIDNYRLKSINTAISKVGEAKLTMKREKSIFLINAASVAKNERPVWGEMYPTREDTRGLAGDYVEKSWGVEGASEREKRSGETKNSVYQCLFSVLSVFIVSMLRIGVLYW
jgi:hypothetical protein